MDLFDYRRGDDLMSEKDGGPKQDWKNGMLSRLAKAFGRPHTAFENILVVVCSIGVVTAVAVYLCAIY